MNHLKSLKDAGKAWAADNAPQLSAALAFYSIFSLGPLLIIAIAVAGMVFGEDAAQGMLQERLSGVMGERSAGALQDMLQQNQLSGKNTLMAGVGLVALLISASGIFAQLKAALNTVWKVDKKSEGGVARTIKTRLLSIAMVLGMGLLLLGLLILSAVLSAAHDRIDDIFQMPSVFWQAINILVSFAVMTWLFAAIYKILPDVDIRWRDVWAGAALTALLFMIGQHLLAIYLGREAMTSGYGAAGAFVLILFWIYYSALILLYGAEFTHIHTTSRRSMAT
jgi:membrane protein